MIAQPYSRRLPLPLFSIVIPARDEESTLPGCIESIRVAEMRLVTHLAARTTPYSDLPDPLTEGLQKIDCHNEASHHVELIVVVNRCTDSTESVAHSLGAATVHADGRNLSAVRNCGIRAAKAEWIVTIDADSRLSPNALISMYEALAHGASGGGVMIVPERWSIGIALTGLIVVGVLLLRRISVGSFYFTRDAFLAIKGFNESLASAEDIDFARRLRAWGKESRQPFRTLWNTTITTSCRKFDTFGDWYFLLHPRETLALFKGKNQELANKVWYEFPH
jgi:glycosyltransferase involved in cell wall biosynthesis